jgi:hypothetical protein
LIILQPKTCILFLKFIQKKEMLYNGDISDSEDEELKRNPKLDPNRWRMSWHRRRLDVEEKHAPKDYPFRPLSTHKFGWTLRRLKPVHKQRFADNTWANFYKRNNLPQPFMLKEKPHPPKWTKEDLERADYIRRNLGKATPEETAAAVEKIKERFAKAWPFAPD